MHRYFPLRIIASLKPWCDEKRVSRQSKFKPKKSRKRFVKEIVCRLNYRE